MAYGEEHALGKYIQTMVAMQTAGGYYFAKVWGTGKYMLFGLFPWP